MKTFSLFLSAMVPIIAHSGVATAVSVPYTPTPIKIDGHFIHLHEQDKNLGDSIWRKAAKISGLPRTTVYSLHDENFLYFGFLCSGEEQGEAKGDTRTRDNTSMWKDSCIEIFLDVNGRTYQFILTHVGAASDLMSGDTRFDFDIRAHALWDTWDWKNWYLEAALPIPEIDPGRKSSTWRFNFCRTMWRNGKMSTVSLVPRGNYKTLTFAGRYGGGKGLSIASPNIEISPGSHRARLTIENPEHDKGMVRIVAETESLSGTILREEGSIRLQGKATETAAFKYSFGEEEGASRFTVRLVNPSGLISASTTSYYDLKTVSSATTFLDSSTYFSNAREATLTLNLDLKKLSASLDNLKLNIQVTRFGSETPLIKIEQECKRKQNAISLPISKLRPGAYQVTTLIVNRTTGRILSRFEDRFEKSDYSF